MFFIQKCVPVGVVLLILVCLSTRSFCKEIEVSKEWTVVGENDTIPAGVHVRMDMTTGEKLVKLIDDADNNAAVSIDTNGNIMEESSSSLTVQPEKEKEEPKYDFEMMHRTLSKLPLDELERIGGLPSVDDTERLKEIWTMRQEELKALQDAEDGLANLPQVLKDRIESLRLYLENPAAHLKSLVLDNGEKQQDWDDNVVSVLQDLEYHLSDIDMARDFHTLGGWPLLVSLLDNTVHHNETQTPETSNKIQVIQTHVAWAIGTMVKNTAEFYPYALERVTSEGETVLSLLLKHLDRNLEFGAIASREALYQKVLYALGALLRGNRMGQEYFVTTLLGPQVLSTVLTDLQQQCIDSVSCIKLIKRILLLAHDVVSDVILHPHAVPSAASDKMDEAIVEAFTTSAWCGGILSTLDQPVSDSTQQMEQLHTAALTAIRELFPFCQSTWRTKDLRRILQSVQSSWSDNDEVQELVEATIVAIKK